VLRSYVPALVFVVIGLGFFFAFANAWLGVRAFRNVEPYECGLPSDVKREFRFGVSFNLVAISITFDLEVILLLPVVLRLTPSGSMPSPRQDPSSSFCSWPSL
jgi:NADH-quinone oxidoreductase subunit A